MDAVWRDVLLEALSGGIAQSRGAVPGAKLKQLVGAVAKGRGLLYPPEGSEQEKFADFLAHFDADVVILRRKGRDLLAAPVGSAHLLFKDSSPTSAQLRPDVFKAFTQIPKSDSNEKPWYVVATDQFTWAIGDAALDVEQMRPVPAASVEVEKADRRAFLETMSLDADTGKAILETLEGTSALWAFSQAIRTRGLSKRWHAFRFQQIVTRIHSWCKESGVPWRESWVTDSEAPLQATVQTATPAPQRDALTQLLGRLNDADLQRISVPLDLVLRLLKG